MEIDSYSTVVDAARCQIYHKNFREFFDDQIATATCVILSRTQNVDGAKLEADMTIIRGLNPDARVITTPWDELDGKIIFDAMTGSTDGFPADLGEDEDEDDEEEEHEHHHHHEDGEECECHHHHEDGEECECHHHHEDGEECECHHHHEDGEECECHHHDHDEEHEHHHHHKHADPNEGLSEGNRIYLGEDEHEHHHHHHHGEHDADEVFDSIGIETINKYSRDELKAALAGLGENIIRAKGIVPDKDGGWLFFDYVPGDTEIRPGTPAYTGLITIIGEKVDLELIKHLFGVK